MDQIPFPGPTTIFHIRINALFIWLWLVDTIMFLSIIEHMLGHGIGGVILFASEVSLMSILSVLGLELIMHT